MFRPIYLDMDGVLMDFESHVATWLKPVWRGRLYHHLPIAEWTEEEQTNDRRYKQAMADHKFWHTMGPMADAHELWDWVRFQTGGAGMHYVLTATPANIDYAKRCAADKLASIHRHFDPTFPKEQFHAVVRSEKRAFARDGAILVDDMPPNCIEWELAGGTAILHKDTKTTIKRLKELHNDKV